MAEIISRSNLATIFWKKNYLEKWMKNKQTNKQKNMEEKHL